MDTRSATGRDRLVRDVSRSFYLTLRVLPSAVRDPISLAYLLARATDSVADSATEPVPRRLEALREMSRAIAAAGCGESSLHARPAGGAVSAGSAEARLLEEFGNLLQDLRSLEQGDRAPIAGVLHTICGGQELDLTRFGNSGAAGPVALVNDQELDDYTWRVAGCVGEFWTKMCLAHLFTLAGADEVRFLSDGIRFGKGLQLVNILRDVAGDLRIGRCYIPASRLAEAGLTPRDLLDPAVMPRFRPVYNAYLRLAGEHLTAGSRYLRALPRRQPRIRLACALPLEIGRRTLERLRAGNPLDPSQRIKVPRREIRSVLARSVAFALCGAGMRL